MQITFYEVNEKAMLKFNGFMHRAILSKISDCYHVDVEITKVVLNPDHTVDIYDADKKASFYENEFSEMVF